MTRTIHDRLLKRELGYSKSHSNRYSAIRGIYGDQSWVEDLDIVNELDGHQGCVNALSWSKTGNLLASGSDDQHVNIHSYLPAEDSPTQFRFTTTIATGHSQNIFSVKFMPHSSDRTIVSAAGDSEVRIFDIEYSGRGPNSQTATNFRSSSHARGMNNVFDGVRYLSEGDSNAKVFRSHSDRVKRIVTEDSPWLFLTCAEDGEVRQWDVRQSSAAYPAPRNVFPRAGNSSSHANVDAPPPLISYKNYNLDLNTISCSASQPHYIALGGAHLHCFLHDRRMLGRDRLLERGGLSAKNATRTERDDELFSKATHCVKKFAPNGKQAMKRTDNGHITACKISDAKPNELLVSWSGDYIYNFDIHRTPDARETLRYSTVDQGKGKLVQESNGRKRKRTKAGSKMSQEGTVRAGSRARTESAEALDQEMALKVQYENGQSEEIPIGTSNDRPPVTDERLRERDQLAYRIAKTTVQLRKRLFTLESSKQKESTSADPTGFATDFTSVIGFAAAIIADMDHVMASWRYPLDPSEDEVKFQNTLRDERASARRLVQGAGTLARVLGGKLRMGGSSDAMIDRYFTSISAAGNERRPIHRREQFGYDFLKAILLWLDSGIGALIEGFTATKGPSRSSRYPVPSDEASEESLHEIIIPYLLRLASDKPIINLNATPFETEDNRLLFASEKAAVISFAQAVRIPFADLSSAMVVATGEGSSASIEHPTAQDRRVALKFWAFKVGRGILLNAAEGINFEIVDRAFDGLGEADAGMAEEERELTERYQPPNEDPVVERATVVTRTRSQSPFPASLPVDDEDKSEDVVPIEDLMSMEAENDSSESESEPELDEPDDEDDDENDTDENEDDLAQRIFWRSNYSRRSQREKVEARVPCGTHTRIFKGHCNVKTVKDVNFYGLEDEYVVSGSDSGHLFIWQKETGKLLNILEGDGEVVNVVQGHPYEPMIAVSGIDHTVKIFSADKRARFDARMGNGVTAADSSSFSSINYGRRRRRPRQNSEAQTEPLEENLPELDPDSDDETKVAPNGLASRRRIEDEYQITSENDNARSGGNTGGTFVTQAMLMRLVAHIRSRQAAGEDVDLPVMLNDADGDCQVM